MLKSFISSLVLLSLLKQSNPAIVNIPVDIEDLGATKDLPVLDDGLKFFNKCKNLDQNSVDKFTSA